MRSSCVRADDGDDDGGGDDGDGIFSVIGFFVLWLVVWDDIYELPCWYLVGRGVDVP